jgi:hypothetical protein
MKSQQNNWKLLYRIGGTAILLAAIVFRRNWSAELSVSQGFGIFPIPDPLPSTALEWFTLLHEHPFVGLSLLELFDLINFALVGLFFLALYAALHKMDRSSTLLAAASGLIGVAVYLGANKALEMLSLGKQYFAALEDAQRSVLLFAGDAILTTTYPDPLYQPIGLHIGLFLVLLAGLIFSVVMLRSRLFGKAAAICGILANGTALSGFIALAFAPVIYLIFPTVSAPFRMIWYILTAIKLLKLKE